MLYNALQSRPFLATHWIIVLTNCSPQQWKWLPKTVTERQAGFPPNSLNWGVCLCFYCTSLLCMRKTKVNQYFYFFGFLNLTTASLYLPLSDSFCSAVDRRHSSDPFEGDVFNLLNEQKQTRPFSFFLWTFEISLSWVLHSGMLEKSDLHVTIATKNLLLTSVSGLWIRLYKKLWLCVLRQIRKQNLKGHIVSNRLIQFLSNNLRSHKGNEFLWSHHFFDVKVHTPSFWHFIQQPHMRKKEPHCA